MSWYNPSWLHPNQTPQASTFIPYSDPNKAASTLGTNNYQNSSIAPFSNTPQGISAAYNTPNYQVAAANSAAYYNDAINGASTYNNGGGGASSSPNAGYDMGNLQNTARDRINAILGAYNSMNGLYDQQLQDTTNQYNKQYDTQLKGLNDQYGTSQNQIAGSFQGRGTISSSDYGNAQQQAGNTYNTNMGSLTDARQATLAGLGRQAASAHAGVASGQQGYGDMLGQVGNYSGADLTSLLPTLQSSLGNVNQQVAGLGSNQSFINQLQQYAPQANQGASQLQAQLQSLIGHGYPTGAQNQIANGLIGQAKPTDPGYYQDYYQKLQSGQGA